jgi:hypothetical protein
MAEFVSTNSAGVARQRPARVTGVVLGAFLCASAACWLAPVAAQQKSPVPDLAGDANTAWFVIGDEFLPPPGGGPGPITFDKRHPYVDNAAARRAGIQPTYRVADLTNPILQPWAREQMKKANDEVLAGKVPFRARERCYPAGVPAFVVYTLAEPIYIVQTAKQVTMINQGGPEVRRIYLDVPHSAQVKPSWYGESVGHYETGDTLVVDTIGVTTRAFVDNYRTPHTDKLHVVERFKLIEGGKRMEILITVDDPGAFTTPWSAMHRFRRDQAGPMNEHICAENNPNYFDYDPVAKPQADKPDF